MMITCVECGGRVSSSAEACVHCGRVFRPRPVPQVPGVGTIAMGVFLGTVGASVVIGLAWALAWLAFLGSMARSLSQP